MQIFHDIFATGLEVRKERNLVTDLLKVIKGQMQTYRPERRKPISIYLPKKLRIKHVVYNKIITHPPSNSNQMQYSIG
jgi:hypothetical protein